MRWHGIEGEVFRFGSPSHVGAMLLTLLVPLLLAALVRRYRSERLTRTINYSFAVLLLGNLALYYWVRGSRFELSLQEDLPLHVCDLLIFLAPAALIWRRQWMYECSYFWAMAGTLQGILTPDLHFAFPHVMYFIYFVNHCGVVAAALYMTLGLGMRPYPVSILRVFLLSQVYFVVVMAANIAFGLNYGYLMQKPLNPTLLDHLGPWPLYIVSMQLLAPLFFLLFYLPFLIMDARAVERRAEKRALHEAEIAEEEALERSRK